MAPTDEASSYHGYLQFMIAEENNDVLEAVYLYQSSNGRPLEI